MTTRETSQVLKLIKIAYPHSFSKLSREDMLIMLNLWTDSFKADDYEEVYTAARKYIMDGKFAPTIADIREYMHTISRPPMGEYAAIEAAFASAVEQQARLIGGCA